MDWQTTLTGVVFITMPDFQLLEHVHGAADEWLPANGGARPGTTMSTEFFDGVYGTMPTSTDGSGGGVGGCHMVNEARFLELLLQAYTADRLVYHSQLRDSFEAADGDSDGDSL